MAKVLLLNTMLEQKVSQAELVRRMCTVPQHVSRLINLKHATRIDTLAEALCALRGNWELKVG